MRAVGQADRGGGAAQLLHRHAMGEIAHARPAIVRLGGDAEKAERAELGQRSRGKALSRSISSARGSMPLAREAADAGAKGLDFLAEAEAQTAHRTCRVLPLSRGGSAQARRASAALSPSAAQATRPAAARRSQIDACRHAHPSSM